MFNISDLRKEMKNKNTGSQYYFKSLCVIAEEKGINSERLLRISNLKVDLDQERIPVESLSKLQLLIWHILDDESMGVLCRPLRKGSFYLATCLAISQSTLRESLVKVISFYNLSQPQDFIFIKENENETTITLKLLNDDYGKMVSEIFLLAFHRLSSWLVNEELFLKKVCFNYVRPEHYVEYNYLFPCSHYYDEQELSISFSSDYLKKKVLKDMDSVELFIRKCPTAIFKRYDVNLSFSIKVKKAIRETLEYGDCNIVSVSKILNKSPRTIMRNLKKESVNFQEIKDIVRREQAVYYLKLDGFTINDIANILGFTEPSGFNRFFKKNFDMSPKEFRVLNKK